MVHPPGMQRKRPAAAPPAGVVLEAEEDRSGDGNVLAAHKRVKPTKPSPPPHQDIYGDIISEPPPLGLQLRKSASFLDLIQSILSKANSTVGQPPMDNIISMPPMKKHIKSGALTAVERPKASHFSGNFLKIGNWEYTSQYEGDLVAKFYYAKHKLVWEVLDAGFKSKIELQWSHITMLKATCPEDEDGTLDLVLSRPPVFFQEIDPQPRKHTIWKSAPDFTGGQASMYRRHILRCSSSLLSRNFEKIIQCDQRLYQLSKQPFIILDSPIFEARSSMFESPNESDGPSPKFTHLASPCGFSSLFGNDGVKPLMLKQSEHFSRPMNLGVVASDVQAKYVVQEQKSPNLCNVEVSGLRSSMEIEERAAGHTQIPNVEVPCKELLEVAESLLSDTHGPPSADEKFLMARVDSLCCLLEKDTMPATMPISEHNGIIDVAEIGSDDFSERTVDGVVSSVISRNDSFADMLENLPRVASVAQFLFDIGEDLENPSLHF